MRWWSGTGISPFWARGRGQGWQASSNMPLEGLEGHTLSLAPPTSSGGEGTTRPKFGEIYAGPATHGSPHVALQISPTYATCTVRLDRKLHRPVGDRKLHRLDYEILCRSHSLRVPYEVAK